MLCDVDIKVYVIIMYWNIDYGYKFKWCVSRVFRKRNGIEIS